MSETEKVWELWVRLHPTGQERCFNPGPFTEFDAARRAFRLNASSSNEFYPRSNRPLEPPPSTPGSATSGAAAENVAPFLGNKREEIYDFIRRKGTYGATADEFYAETKSAHTGHGTRFYELNMGGYIRQHDTEATRPTRGRSRAAVWVVTAKLLEPGWSDGRHFARFHKVSSRALRKAARDVVNTYDTYFLGVEGEIAAAIERLREVIGGDDQ